MQIYIDGALRDATPEEIAEIEAQRVIDAVEFDKLKPVPTIHIAWLRAALAEIDMLDAVNSAVAAAGPIKQQIWDYATTIPQNNPDVVAIAGALGLNLPQLFERANQIKVENEP